MFVWLSSLALAAPGLEATLFAGARTAPESAIMVPSAWEGDFEPSGVVAADVRARLGQGQGPWARLELGAMGYAPDGDASLGIGGVGIGWGGRRGALDLSAAGRCDGQVFPWLGAASNERAEVVLRARHDAPGWSLGGQLAGVDRRFVGAAGFSTAELGAVLALTPGAWGVDVGASGQGNRDWAGQPGAQARSLLRVHAGGASWRVVVDHRFIYALEGEVEEETHAAFTPFGDYADDVDALSGGGFVQQRIGASGAVDVRGWTVSAAGFARFRSPEEEEEARISFVRTWAGQARVQRAVREGVAVFVVAGASSATVGTGAGYLDTFGWVGVELRTREE